MPSFRTMRRVALGVWAAGALFVYPAAHAQAALPIPVPSVSLPPLLPQVPLPTSTATPVPLPSVPIVGELLDPTPLPTVTGVPGVPLPGNLGDTVNGVTGLLGIGGTTGSPAPTTGGGSGSTGQRNGSTGSGTSKSSPGSTGSHVGTSGQTVLDGIGVITPDASFDSPYATITGQAAKRAAGRALDLAGPLAPPLLLGCIALGVMLMLSRGSSRLVKLDLAGFARRTWQI